MNDLLARKERYEMVAALYGRRARREWQASHRRFLLFMDFLFVLALLANVGASTITNFLVMRAPDVALVEANPSTAQREGYATTAQAQRSFSFLYVKLYLYGFLLAGYLFLRLSVTGERSQFWLALYTVLLCFMFVSNFGNDFGYLLGGWWYG